MDYIFVMFGIQAEMIQNTQTDTRQLNLTNLRIKWS